MGKTCVDGCPKAAFPGLTKPVSRIFAVSPFPARKMPGAGRGMRGQGCTVSEIAMRYLFSGDMNVFAVISTTDPGRMRSSNIRISGISKLQKGEIL